MPTNDIDRPGMAFKRSLASSSNASLLSSTLQIEQRKLQLAKLRRMQFGRSLSGSMPRSRSCTHRGRS